MGDPQIRIHLAALTLSLLHKLHDRLRLLDETELPDKLTHRMKGFPPGTCKYKLRIYET